MKTYTPDDLDELRGEFESRPRKCGECGLREEHMPNCPGDPESEPQEGEE